MPGQGDHDGAGAGVFAEALEAVEVWAGTEDIEGGGAVAFVGRLQG